MSDPTSGIDALRDELASLPHLPDPEMKVTAAQTLALLRQYDPHSYYLPPTIKEPKQ